MKKIFLVGLIAVMAGLFSCSDNSSTNGSECPKTLPAVLASLYDCQPNIDNCTEGQLTNAEKMKVLSRLNAIRSLHGLPLVTYNYADDNVTQKSALITAANIQMNHFPVASSKCYSDSGFKGCNEGNLWLGQSGSPNSWASEKTIDSWLIDINVETLGHRRWLLNPCLKTIAFGRVDRQNVPGSYPYVTAATIKVFDNKNFSGKTDFTGDFVAYPQGEYPANLFNTSWFLSFSVINDKNDYWNGKSVDYSNSTISVTSENNQTMAISNALYNSQDAYGYPNNLQWKVTGLVKGVLYNVSIKNVKLGSTTKTYNYSFRLGADL